MRIALINNRDSFVFNLRQLLRASGTDVSVLSNTDLNGAASFDRLVFSPGPGLPNEAGLLEEIIRTYAGSKPMLGICLGEQAIATAFGGSLIQLHHVFHGIQSDVRRIADDPILKNLPETISVGRYHSWAVNPDTLPNMLQITAVSDEGLPMALRHTTLPIHGLQFHPESILTPDGQQMIDAFLRL